FDTVFTLGAIWTNPYKAFTEYARILKADGHLIGSATEAHDTTFFFKLFSRIYGIQTNIMHDEEFLIISATMTDSIQNAIRMDARIVDTVSAMAVPEREDLRRQPKTFDDESTVHTINKEDALAQLKALGYTEREIRTSL